MKKILSILSFICAVNLLNAQVDSTKSETNKDTTRISFGNREINIIESEDGTDINVRKKDQEWKHKEGDHKYDWKEGRKSWRHSGGFRGHWDGVELGYNAFLNKDMEMSLSGSDAFMSLNSSPMKSMNLNANFLQVSRNIIGNSFGFVTGLRIEFNNYVFDNNITIAKNSAGVIDSIRLPYNADKSKLTVAYFSIPLLFEFQFPGALSFRKRMWMSAGIVGSLKLDSHTKIKYRENGEKRKEKNHDDFNISALRYGFTARMGYSNFYAYGNYYPVQFFEKDKGPELYQFSVGVGMHFN